MKRKDENIKQYQLVVDNKIIDTNFFVYTKLFNKKLLEYKKEILPEKIDGELDGIIRLKKISNNMYDIDVSHFQIIKKENKILITKSFNYGKKTMLNSDYIYSQTNIKKVIFDIFKKYSCFFSKNYMEELQTCKLRELK